MLEITKDDSNFSSSQPTPNADITCTKSVATKPRNYGDTRQQYDKEKTQNDKE